MMQINNRLTALESQGLNYQNTHKQVISRMDALESRLKEIAESQRITENQFRELYAGLRADANTGRHEVRQIQGRLEEIEYHLKQKFSNLKPSSRKSDGTTEDDAGLIKRIVRIEQYLGMQPYVPEEKPAPSVNTGDTAKPEEEDLYSSAKKAYDTSDFDTARMKFASFLAKNPKSTNADNAQFWIGESYFNQKWFEKAILEYQKVIEEYPTGNKVPAALLKQGLAFQELDDKSNAKLILKELIRKYPNSNEANIARKKISSLE
jgi:tol-pal system protein YbgF